MIKIEVKSTTVTPRPVTFKNGPNAGKQGVFHEQEAWATMVSPDGKPHPYPQRIVLNIDVDKGHAAYPVGVYQIAPQSFYIDRFNSLTLGRLYLDVQPAVRAAA